MQKYFVYLGFFEFFESGGTWPRISAGRLSQSVPTLYRHITRAFLSLILLSLYTYMCIFCRFLFHSFPYKYIYTCGLGQCKKERTSYFILKSLLGLLIHSYTTSRLISWHSLELTCYTHFIYYLSRKFLEKFVYY